MKPQVFVGCSAESLSVARALQAGLRRDLDVAIWDQGLFPLSGAILDRLIEASKQFDYAVMILGHDDVAEVRGETRHLPRDNVLFELGLFVGAIGKARTFVVASATFPDQQILSDYSGIVVAHYDSNSHGGNLRAAVGTAATDILDAIARDHPVAGDWRLHIQSSGGDVPNGVMRFVCAGDRVSASLSLEVDRNGEPVKRDFVYDGIYKAGQVILSFSQAGAEDQIIGAMVIRLRADRRSMEGRTTFWHHDRAEMVTTNFELRR